MNVTVIPGVGPATAERLRRAGIQTVAELESVDLDELVRLVGRAHGTGLHQLARALDDRPVVPEREAKSVSVEGTYETDLADRKLMEGLLTRQAGEVASRLRKHGLSGRTVSIKVRLHDFTTLSRSTTLAEPTDSTATIARLARGAARPTSTPPAACGCSASASPGSPTGSRTTCSARPRPSDEPDARGARAVEAGAERRRATWGPGQDVEHDEHGPRLGVGLGPRASSPSASRPPRRPPGRCGPSRSTTPRCTLAPPARRREVGGGRPPAS